MRIHNRSPTKRNEPHKNKQCRHTFRITHSRCAPCNGYKLNCERYETTAKDAADTKTSEE